MNITRNGAIGGVAAALAAIAVAIPAVSSADRGRGHDGDRGETVGTVESFDEATSLLTIAPTEGDAISATVTDRTKIQCRDHGSDDDESGDDHGDDGPNHDSDDDHGHDGSGHGKRGHGGRRGNCSTDALVAGAEVEDADLDLTSAGLVFEEVELR